MPAVEIIYTYPHTYTANSYPADQVKIVVENPVEQMTIYAIYLDDELHFRVASLLWWTISLKPLKLR